MSPHSPSRLIALLAAALGCASAHGPASDPYVFAWPFVEAAMEPRGGTTRGAEVTLETRPGPAWQRLRAAGPAAGERDRAAILALAGDYRASFDFLETVLFEPGAEPARPYRSWGTERIYVLEEQPDFVRLQHILVMFVAGDAGELQGPFVQKHWRQDWRYEPESLLVYAGEGRFELRPVTEEARRGAWSQTVYQVDDSPRYAALGRWRHEPEASVWRSGDGWRPLPRREHTVRDDYDVLAGSHRIDVLALGWVHAQDNVKLALEGADPRAVAREIGVSRYERIRDFDFSAGDAYWAATAPWWAEVRAVWARRIRQGEPFRVRAQCEDEPTFARFFRVAARLEAGEALSPAEQRAEAERALACVFEELGAPS